MNQEVWKRKKDKRPRQGTWGRWKKFLKYFGAKKHRQAERQAIRHEEEDELSNNSYKKADNPWNYD